MYLEADNNRADYECGRMATSAAKQSSRRTILLLASVLGIDYNVKRLVVSVLLPCTLRLPSLRVIRVLRIPKPLGQVQLLGLVQTWPPLLFFRELDLQLSTLQLACD